MQTVSEFTLPQYKIVKFGKKFYIQVLRYNPMVWHSWNYGFIAKSGYPVDDGQIKYAKNFDNEEDAKDFLNTIIPK